MPNAKRHFLKKKKIRRFKQREEMIRATIGYKPHNSISLANQVVNDYTPKNILSDYDRLLGHL